MQEDLIGVSNMTTLELGLQQAGLLDLAYAKAKELGTTIEGALRSLLVTDQAVVCEKSFEQWKAKAEAFAGRELQDYSVVLYKMFGKVNASELTSDEWLELEVAYPDDSD